MGLSKRKGSNTNGKNGNRRTFSSNNEDEFDPFDEGTQPLDGSSSGGDEGVSVRRGMHPEVQQEQQRDKARFAQRQQFSYFQEGSPMADALQGQDDTFKRKVYEVMMEYNLDTDDPAFLMLVATGRLEMLLHEKPQEMSALFDQWYEMLHTQIVDYKSGLEQYERTAVKALQPAIVAAAHDMVTRITVDKFLQSFTLASLLLAGATVLGSLGLGALYGYRLKANEVDRVLYAPGAARQLTVAEANALTWANSVEGKRSKELWEWNRDLLYNYACEAQTQRYGLTLELQGQKAQNGACVLWVRPIQERKLLAQPSAQRSASK